MTTAQLKARGLTKHPGGRPPVKSPEVCQKLLEVIRTGLPLKFSAASVGVTYEALNQWREKDPEFSKGVELARLASVKERWELIQAAARGNEDAPGDWHAAAWSIERTWPLDFGKPEAQLLVQNNIANITQNNEIHITFEVAERLESRGREMEAEIEHLIESRKDRYLESGS
jgi:hypothetical protein